MRTSRDFLVAMSIALTDRIPLASMAKVTLIFGTPRGAGGDAGELEAVERAVVVGHLALALEHGMGTKVWLSSEVENSSLRCGDGGVARDERSSRRRPSRRRGRAGSRRGGGRSARRRRWRACTRRADRDDLVGRGPAALGRAPNSDTARCTMGMRVMPPTSTDLLDVADGERESARPCGRARGWPRDEVADDRSSSARLSTRWTWAGPAGVVAMKGGSPPSRATRARAWPSLRPRAGAGARGGSAAGRSRAAGGTPHPACRPRAGRSRRRRGRCRRWCSPPEDAAVDLEDRDVEGAAAEVVHRDALGLAAVEP